MKICNSGPKVSVLHEQIHRRNQGPIETCNFGAKHALLFAKIHR